MQTKERIAQIYERYGEANLVEMVHIFLSTEAQEQQIKRVEDGRIGKFYPSSVGDCKRKIFYQMKGYPGKLRSGQNLLVTENGTSFHNRMEDIFERMGIMIAPELSLKDPELRISGRSDAIIYNFMKEENEPDGEIIKLYRPATDKDAEPELVYEGPANDVLIVEFKSIKSKGYNEYLPKTKPKKQHEMQLQLYFYLTGIRKGMVYYENKDNQSQKYFVVEYNEAIVQTIIDDIKFIIKAIDDDIIPEREFQPTSFECRYCDFRDICWPNMNNIDYTKLI